jgi:hypothetical protein
MSNRIIVLHTSPRDEVRVFEVTTIQKHEETQFSKMIGTFDELSHFICEYYRANS